MYLISLLWRYAGELIRPKGSIQRLSHCLAILPSVDNYNVNDWVLKEALAGHILNSACTALCTWESLQTLGQSLISSVQKRGPYYAALPESLIIIFVRAALFISTSVSSDCKLYSPCSHLYCCWQAPKLRLYLCLSRSLPGSKGSEATRCSPRLFVVSLSQKLIAKQKVLACPIEQPCKGFTATAPFCAQVKYLIIKASQKSLIRDKGAEEEEEEAVVL